MRTIRASEIASYLYCKRAWWYALRGIAPANRAEFASGTEMHQRHGRAVLAAGCLKLLALALFIAALVCLTIYLVSAWLV